MTTEATYQRIRELRKNGKVPIEISRELSISIAIVRKVFHKKPGPKPRPPELREFAPRRLATPRKCEQCQSMVIYWPCVKCNTDKHTQGGTMRRNLEPEMPQMVDLKALQPRKQSESEPKKPPVNVTEHEERFGGEMAMLLSRYRQGVPGVKEHAIRLFRDQFGSTELA